MSRTSPDFYQKQNGEIVAVWQDKEPPVNSVLIKGYDYHNQKWVEDVKGIILEYLKTKTIKKFV